MPISIDYEFTFGGVPCLVTTTTGSRPTAWMYVIETGRHALRPLVDDAGQRVEILGATDRDALDGALLYLERRFGARGAAWNRVEPRSQAELWTILRDTPVRPDDDTRSLDPAITPESLPLETRVGDILIRDRATHFDLWSVTHDGATEPDPPGLRLFATDRRAEALEKALEMAARTDTRVFVIDSRGSWTLVRRPGDPT